MNLFKSFEIVDGMKCVQNKMFIKVQVDILEWLNNKEIAEPPSSHIVLYYRMINRRTSIITYSLVLSDNDKRFVILIVFEFNIFVTLFNLLCLVWGRRGRDHMVVGFTTTYAISTLPPLMVWVRITIRARCTTSCDKVCQWLATSR